MNSFAFLIFSILSFQSRAEDCVSQVILNSRAVQRIVEIGAKTISHRGQNDLEDGINSALKKINEKPITKEISNFYFGGFTGTSTGVLRFSNMKVKNLQMGEPKLVCPNSGWKCKVSFPIKGIDLVTDFKLNKLICADSRTPIEKCEKPFEKNYIEINRYKVGFDMTGTGAVELPEVSFNVDIRPGEPLEKMLQVDPQSVQLKIVPEMIYGLTADLDLLNDEWAKIKKEINRLTLCKLNPSLAKTNKETAELNESIILDAHKPYIKNDLSMTFYNASRAVALLLKSAQKNPNVGEQEKEQLNESAQVLTQGLSNRFGGALAQMLNSAMENSEDLKGGLKTKLPIFTPKSFSSPSDPQNTRPQRTQELKITGTGTDREGNLVIEASNCTTDFDNMKNRPISPRFHLEKGETSGAALSLKSINTYLSEMLADKNENILSIAGKQKSSFSAFNSDMKLQFNVKELKLVTKDGSDKSGKKLLLQFEAEENMSSDSVLNPLHSKTQKTISGKVEIKKNDQGELDLILDHDTFQRYNTDRSSGALFLSGLRSAVEMIFIKDIVVKSIYVKTLNNQLDKYNLADYVNEQLASKVVGKEKSSTQELQKTKDILRYNLNQFEVSDDTVIFSGGFTNQKGLIAP